MRKIYMGLALSAMLFALGSYAEAQQAGRIYRIGFLDRGYARASAVRMEPFLEELRRLGWIEGKNIWVEFRFAEEGPRSRTAEQAAELVRLKVDVIVCASTDACLAAKKATPTIALVFPGAADPVRAGLIISLARPGGNITGVTGLSAELNTKRLEVLKDAVPKLSRVGIPQRRRDNTGVSPALQMKELKLAAAALKLDLVELPTKLDAKDLEAAFQSAKEKNVGAILIFGRPLFALRKQVVRLAAKYRLPAIYPQKEFIDEGGLMYYGSDDDDQLRVAAGYVDKILKGAKPADLPVQLPTKFEFIISLKAAKEIGLTLSPEFLSRANRVIK